MQRAKDMLAGRMSSTGQSQPQPQGQVFSIRATAMRAAPSIPSFRPQTHSGKALTQMLPPPPPPMTKGIAGSFVPQPRPRIRTGAEDAQENVFLVPAVVRSDYAGVAPSRGLSVRVGHKTSACDRFDSKQNVSSLHQLVGPGAGEELSPWKRPRNPAPAATHSLLCGLGLGSIEAPAPVHVLDISAMLTGGTAHEGASGNGSTVAMATSD